MWVVFLWVILINFRILMDSMGNMYGIRFRIRLFRKVNINMVSRLVFMVGGFVIGVFVGVVGMMLIFFVVIWNLMILCF